MIKRYNMSLLLKHSMCMMCYEKRTHIFCCHYMVWILLRDVLALLCILFALYLHITLIMKRQMPEYGHDGNNVIRQYMSHRDNFVAVSWHKLYLSGIEGASDCVSSWLLSCDGSKHHCCQSACQISMRYGHFETRSHAFDTLHNLVIWLFKQ